MQYGRIPCPWRVLDDLGGGFALGCASGAIMYFIKGMWNSPKKEKMAGAFRHVARRAPVLGGIWCITLNRQFCALGRRILNSRLLSALGP